MRKTLALLALPLLFAAGCQAPGEPSAPAAADREMGTLVAIYPHYSDQGNWWLEYRLTRDTVFVDFEAARSLVADTAWKRALTRSVDVFFDNGEGCMYARSVTGCLAFVDSPDTAAAPGL
jgi:hypothetical protein